eukprot:maker-scaffold_11-snap-gene-7.0-mRNA-1 protein AED:0.00 eAED:0.00 QI:132/1/1/1/1/1/3/143/543
MNGIHFPLNESNIRSSSTYAKALLCHAMGSLDKDLTARIQKEKNWRYNYAQYFVELVKLSVVSPDVCFKVSNAALEYIQDTMEFLRDGKSTKLKHALESPYFSFNMMQVEGTAPKSESAQLSLNYKGKVLKNEEVCELVSSWADCGTISQDTAEAHQLLLEEKEKFFSGSSSLFRENIFVCFGASSEMGPLHHLLTFGATVVAIDLPKRPNLWKKLVNFAIKSPGTLIFPVKGLSGSTYTGNELTEPQLMEICEAAGSDLITETPEIANWLLNEPLFAQKNLVLGQYTYLDSDLFPRITVACDFISTFLQHNREKDTIFATLSSAADVFLVNEEAVEMAEQRMRTFTLSNLTQKALNALTLNKILQPNNHIKVASPETGDLFYICDGLATIQGPNYALAKRMQHWRAVWCQQNGVKVSSNIAPATFTQSVEHNKLTLYISRSISNFKPIMVFDKDTTKSIMTNLLLFDVADWNINSASHLNSNVKLRNPLELVSRTAVDCGVWRSAVKIGTAGEAAIMIYGLGAILESIGLNFLLQQPFPSKL